jgi:hypothetical protein
LDHAKDVSGSGIAMLVDSLPLITSKTFQFQKI